MIYTLTMNPSLDYVLDLDQFTMGALNRAAKEQYYPGGKGLNVSVVLRNLGLETTALGFVAGFVGQEVERLAKRIGISTEFFHLEEGCSRINFSLRTGQITEVNGIGPKLSDADLEKLFTRLEQLEGSDILVMSGSVPRSVDPGFYKEVMKRLNGRGIRMTVDAAGELLTSVMEYHPFLVKPNHHELGDLFGVKITTREEVVPYAKKLQGQGAVNVLVSLGGEGAVLVDENGEVHQGAAPEGKVVNTVGAGDSMVAGFIAGYVQGGDYGRAFRLGLATGSASAFSEYLATRDDVESVLAGMP